MEELRLALSKKFRPLRIEFYQSPTISMWLLSRRWVIRPTNGGFMFKISTTPEPREYDALISTGENVSAALLSMSIIAKGGNAISLNGAQAGIYTSNGHKRAKILDVKPDRIQAELQQKVLWLSQVFRVFLNITM